MPEASLRVLLRDEFKEAVASGMRDFANLTRSQLDGVQSDKQGSSSGEIAMAKPARPAAPSGLSVISEPTPKKLPTEVSSALQFMVKPWGLVLAVRKPAIQYLKGGGAITDAVLGGAAAILPIIPIAGPILSGVCVFLAVFLTANLGMIEFMDQGKGVPDYP